MTSAIKTIVEFMTRVEQHIWQQFNSPESIQELHDLGPEGVDWVARTRKTIDTLLPKLPSLAERIRTHVPDTLNAVVGLLEHIAEGLTHRDGGSPEFKAWYDTLNTGAQKASKMVHNIESQQVSAEIQRYIASPQGLGRLMSPNGNSIYPDLLMNDYDYRMLPAQNRRAPVDGPCLRSSRPSNVPDGCELKTNRGNRIRVDAHGAHPGLHLGVTWDLNGNKINVTGVWVGYIRIADHRESGRNVNATTVKYSFGHDLFVSLI